MLLAALVSEWIPTLSLIFGGCCSNAITLEQLTSQFPHAGSLITFFQFLAISLYGLPKHLTFSVYDGYLPYPHMRPRQIPLTPYLIQVGLFYLISLLNNAGFAYSIPMTVHIIFRSGGLVISMLLGWILAGKKYTATQVISVLMVTGGVIFTILSASGPRAATPEARVSTKSYSMGISILFLALVLSGFLGLVQDWTYRQLYSKPKAHPTERPTPTWQESMFYMHFLSLPLFILLRRDIHSQFQELNTVSSVILSPKWLDASARIALPSPYLPLIFNTITQIICVAGVHRLTTKVSSLTVTLVLVVRKAVSLVLSVFLATSPSNSPGALALGAALVFLGTVGYSLGGSSQTRVSTSQDDSRTAAKAKGE